MVLALILLVGLLALTLVALTLRHVGRVNRSVAVPDRGARRILFPVAERALSAGALEAALRLAHAGGATLVPTFIAIVPAHLPLDASLASESAIAVSLREAIEQRAAEFGVPVDARVEPGRTNRHGLRQTIAQERFDRIVIAAAPNGRPGFNAEDVAWLLNHAVGEIIVVRPSPDDELGTATHRSQRARSRDQTGQYLPSPALSAGAVRSGRESEQQRERSRITA